MKKVNCPLRMLINEHKTVIVPATRSLADVSRVLQWNTRLSQVSRSDPAGSSILLSARMSAISMSSTFLTTCIWRSIQSQDMHMVKYSSTGIAAGLPTAGRRQTWMQDLRLDISEANGDKVCLTEVLSDE